MLSTKLEYSNNLVNGNKIVISFFFMQSLCKLVYSAYVYLVQIISSVKVA